MEMARPWFNTPLVVVLVVGLAYQEGKDIVVFRFIIEYNIVA
jgi:hypothetical protein